MPIWRHVGRLAALVVLALATAVVATPAHAATALAPDWQSGANFTSWWNDTYSGGTSDASLQALRDTGANSVAILSTWYMPTGTSTQIAPDSQKTPTDASILHAMSTARSLGLRVVLKPHVDSPDGPFRGDIRPSDVGAWFASYRTFIDHYADLAQQGGASMLEVGTELTSMSGYTDQWRAIIADVRSRFSGKLTFAANWIDGAQKVGFWDALDYVGIDAYMPLASGDPNPSVDSLVSAWADRCYVSQIAQLQSTWNRPVLFTELGYVSREGTATQPWSWTFAGAISQEPQQRAYEAAYRVWSQVPWFKGIYWWNWNAGSYDPNDGGYNPRGKLAEGVMRAWSGATAPGGTSVPDCAGATPRPASGGGSGTAARCLPASGRISTRAVGPLALGRTRGALERAGGAKATMRGRRARFCVAGGGSVSAVLDGKRRAAVLVAQAPGYAAAGIAPGDAARALGTGGRRWKRIGRGLYAGGPGMRLAASTARGRIRWIAAARSSLARRPARLRAALARARI